MRRQKNITSKLARYDIIILVGMVLVIAGGVAAFAPPTSRSSCRKVMFQPSTRTRTNMVRNIDLAEAIIFYGTRSLVVGSGEEEEEELVSGIESLVQECQRDDTAVLAILEDEQQKQKVEKVLEKYKTLQFGAIKVATQPPPNPRDLMELIHSIEIQPKGFGGSSGFGTKAADPVRSPKPQHCVVFCHNEDQCRAARFVGMRVLCLTDNDLADAIMTDGTWEDIYSMDDIATPGSFWLNPPHPRDDDGNKADPEAIMLALEEEEESEQSSTTTTTRITSEVTNKEMADDQLAAILADMDPL